MGIALVHRLDRESNCISDLCGAIFNINHTGQEHCGIISYDGERFSRETERGLVRELKIPDNMNGYCGVGSVSNLSDHQPLVFYPYFALTSDVFMINRDELRGDMDAFLSPFDPELAGRIISRGKDIPDGIEKLSKEMKGYYCLGIITENGESYIARCPLAVKPLMLGKGKGGYAAITESRAFRKIGMRTVRDIKPGEILKIDEYGIHSVKTIKGKGRKICSFQWGYYAWVDSIIDGIPVSDVRERVIAKLAEKDKKAGLNLDIVSAIEDSGKAYGEGYGLHFGIPYLSTVIKYPYWVRSYERPKEKRSDEASGKVSSVDARIKDKVILICDDSIRRGTVTSEGPVKYTRDAGAKEIHMRIGTPRNTHYCEFDSRTAPDETLPANRYPTNEEMAGWLGVDSMDFPTVDEFVDAILESAKMYGSDLKRKDLCLGCYTGDFGFLD